MLSRTCQLRLVSGTTQLLYHNKHIEFQNFKMRQPRLQCSSMIINDEDVLLHSRTLSPRRLSSSNILMPSPIIKTAPPIAYEIIQGALVDGTDPYSSFNPSVPTVVFVHGIFGSKQNLSSFAKDLLRVFPQWRSVLVDLRCHGESALSHISGPHNVESAARDILQLLNYLKIFPKVLVGHSFGGKVIMSMAKQFGKRLPRPVEAWVLDSLPGEVDIFDYSGVDNPHSLIRALKDIDVPVTNRSFLVDQLKRDGFSLNIARWMTTNLRPINGSPSSNLTWKFDLAGIEEMFNSYVTSSLWPLLESPPEGLKLNFVRAERSHFPWDKEGTQSRIEKLGHQVYTLKNAGHWVHTDNPFGLLEILKNHF